MSRYILEVSLAQQPRKLDQQLHAPNQLANLDRTRLVHQKHLPSVHSSSAQLVWGGRKSEKGRHGLFGVAIRLLRKLESSGGEEHSESGRRYVCTWKIRGTGPLVAQVTEQEPPVRADALDRCWGRGESEWVTGGIKGWWIRPLLTRSTSAAGRAKEAV